MPNLTRTPLVGITGRKRSGKDTVARILAAGWPGLHQVAFADPMKRMLTALNPAVSGSTVADPHERTQMARRLQYEMDAVMAAPLPPGVNRAELAHRGIETLDPLGGEGRRLRDLLTETRGDWDQLKNERDMPEHREVRRLMATFGTDVVRTLYGDSIWCDLAARSVSLLRAAGRAAVITDCRFDNEARTVRGLGGVVVRIVRPDTAAVDPHVSERGVSDELVDLEISNSGTLDDLHATVNASLPNLTATLRGRE